MKRTLLALAAATVTLTAVAPAFAQPYGQPGPAYGERGDRGMRGPGAGYGYGGDFYRGAPQSPRERVQWLQQRIERSVANGSLSRREARQAQRELDRTRDYIQTQRARYGQMRPEDRAYVDQRLDYVRNLIRWQRGN